MKKFLIPVLIMTVSPALADTAPPLEPGKPAGVKAAQLGDDGRGMLIVAGVAAVGIAIALAVAGDSPQPPSSTTDTTP